MHSRKALSHQSAATSKSLPSALLSLLLLPPLLLLLHKGADESAGMLPCLSCMSHHGRH